MKRFRERRADEPFWHALAQRWAAVGTGGKQAALLELLRRNPDEKKLIFVHYRETLEHLAVQRSLACVDEVMDRERRHHRVERPEIGQWLIEIVLDHIDRVVGRETLARGVEHRR